MQIKPNDFQYSFWSKFYAETIILRPTLPRFVMLIWMKYFCAALASAFHLQAYFTQPLCTGDNTDQNGGRYPILASNLGLSQKYEQVTF